MKESSKRTYLDKKGRYPVVRPTEKSTTTTEAPTSTTKEATTNSINNMWLDTTTQLQIDSSSAEATTDFPIFETSTEPADSTDPGTTSSFAQTTTFSNTAAPATTEEFIQIELFPVLSGIDESGENDVSKIVTLSGPGIFAAPKEEDFVKFSSSNFAVTMMKAPVEDLILEESSGESEEGSGSF